MALAEAMGGCGRALAAVGGSRACRAHGGGRTLTVAGGNRAHRGRGGGRRTLVAVGSRARGACGGGGRALTAAGLADLWGVAGGLLRQWGSRGLWGGGKVLLVTGSKAHGAVEVVGGLAWQHSGGWAVRCSGPLWGEEKFYGPERPMVRTI